MSFRFRFQNVRCSVFIFVSCNNMLVRWSEISKKNNEGVLERAGTKLMLLTAISGTLKFIFWWKVGFLMSCKPSVQADKPIPEADKPIPEADKPVPHTPARNPSRPTASTPHMVVGPNKTLETTQPAVTVWRRRHCWSSWRWWVVKFLQIRKLRCNICPVNGCLDRTSPELTWSCSVR